MENSHETILTLSFIIKNIKLDFDEISDRLKLQPTKIVRNGESLSKVVEESQNDIWIYEVKSKENSNTNAIFEKLLNDISPSIDNIKLLSGLHSIYLRLYVQSDYAQIRMDISKNVIQKLSDLNIRLEISVLSWGGVDD